MKMSPSWTPTYKIPRLVSCIRLFDGAVSHDRSAPDRDERAEQDTHDVAAHPGD